MKCKDWGYFKDPFGGYCKFRCECIDPDENDSECFKK